MDLIHDAPALVPGSAVLPFGRLAGGDADRGQALASARRFRL